MTAKQYLWQIRTEKQRIDDLIRGRDELLNTMRMVSSPTIEERVQTSPRDRMPEYAARLDEFESRIQVRVDRYQRFMLKAIHQIDTMTGTTKEVEQSERHVLYLRYILCMDWAQIIDAAPYTERRIYQIHGTALQAFGRQYQLTKLQ